MTTPSMALVGEHAVLMLRAVRAGQAYISPDAATVTVGMHLFAIMLEGSPPRILSDRAVLALNTAMAALDASKADEARETAHWGRKPG